MLLYDAPFTANATLSTRHCTFSCDVAASVPTAKRDECAIGVGLPSSSLSPSSLNAIVLKARRQLCCLYWPALGEVPCCAKFQCFNTLTPCWFEKCLPLQERRQVSRQRPVFSKWACILASRPLPAATGSPARASVEGHSTCGPTKPGLHHALLLDPVSPERAGLFSAQEMASLHASIFTVLTSAQ